MFPVKKGDKPPGKSPACEHQPADYENQNENQSHGFADQIAGPCGYCRSAVSPETAAERICHAGQRAGEGKQDRKNHGSGHGDCKGLEQTCLPLSEKQPQGNGSQQQEKCKAPESEAPGDQKISPAASELAGTVMDITDGNRHRKDTLVFLPCKEIRYDGNKSKYCKGTCHQPAEFQNHLSPVLIQRRKRAGPAGPARILFHWILFLLCPGHRLFPLISLSACIFLSAAVS